MSINCDLTLQWGATPAELKALGTALWRWHKQHVTGDSGIYQALDNQALADLIAGKLPVPSQTARPAERRGVQFRFRDETSHDCQATIACLRREIPAQGVENIMVDGTSWNPSGAADDRGS